MPRRPCGCWRGSTISRRATRGCTRPPAPSAPMFRSASIRAPRIMRGTGEMLSEPLALAAAACGAGQSRHRDRDQGCVRGVRRHESRTARSIWPVAAFPPAATDAIRADRVARQSAQRSRSRRRSRCIPPSATCSRPCGRCPAARSRACRDRARPASDYSTRGGTQAAAQTLHGRHPDWWVRATMFSENLDGNAPA